MPTRKRAAQAPDPGTAPATRAAGTATAATTPTPSSPSVQPAPIGHASATGTPSRFPGYYMGIADLQPETQTARDTRLGAAAGTTEDIGYMLGTVAPRANWPA